MVLDAVDGGRKEDVFVEVVARRFALRLQTSPELRGPGIRILGRGFGL